MDSRNDLTVAVVKNYSWEPLKFYALSLVNSGFVGKRVVFADYINDEARINLTALGFEVVDFTTQSTPGGFFSARYAPVADYLMGKTFRNVIWTDVRDVVFQSNPSIWLEANLAPHELLVCSEGVPLLHEPTNTAWVTNASNGAYTDLTQDQLCSGTIAGKNGAMQALCCAMFECSKEIKHWDSPTGAGSDQGMINCLARTSPFKENTRVVRADEPFALQANWFQLNMYKPVWTSEPPIFDLGKGQAFTSRGELYTILHQYDRDARGWLGDFTSAVERRYAPDPRVVASPAVVPAVVSRHYRPLRKAL